MTNLYSLHLEVITPELRSHSPSSIRSPQLSFRRKKSPSRSRSRSSEHEKSSFKYASSFRLEITENFSPQNHTLSDHQDDPARTERQRKNRNHNDKNRVFHDSSILAKGNESSVIKLQTLKDANTQDTSSIGINENKNMEVEESKLVENHDSIRSDVKTIPRPSSIAPIIVIDDDDDQNTLLDMVHAQKFQVNTTGIVCLNDSNLQKNFNDTQRIGENEAIFGQQIYNMPLNFPDSSISLSINNSNLDPRKKSSISQTQNNKLNLVVDLDETLLNSHTFSQNFDISAINYVQNKHTTTINLGDFKTVIVVKPYISEFLKRISKFYNIFVYSHGREEYVESVLQIIDKDKQYISRDIIFKNYGQVTRNTPKLLSNLKFSLQELNKALILDDQKQIWVQDHHKVICAKKFIPLRQFMPQEKYNRYCLSHKSGSYNDLNWLIHQEGAKELICYSELTVSSSVPCQLQALTKFLEKLAQDYTREVKEDDFLDIAEVYKSKMRLILKDLKVGIISNSEARKKMFRDLATTLGASLIEPRKAHYLLIDESYAEEAQEILARDLKQKNPLLTVLSVFWLVECFFHLSKVNPFKFHYAHF